MNDKKVYILGSGAMAMAMANGLKNSNFDIVIVSRKHIQTNFKNELYNSSYDIDNKNIILAFKPYALDEVSAILKGKAKILLSVLARTSLEQIKQQILANSYAICMPNLAASKNFSITPFLGDSKVEFLIKGFGKAIQVFSQNEFNAAGVISGCAPAYLALVAEALGDGGVLGGLKADVSCKLVQGAFASCAALLEDTHPAIFKQSVCSPAGTTIQGIAKLEEMSTRSAFISALKASLDKQQG